MPPRKTSVSTKPKQSPIQVSARIASRTVKHTEPLNLFTSTIATDSVQNKTNRNETNRNDTSQGENPIAALTDGVIDALPEHSEERSSILIEPTEPVNLSMEQEPKFIYLAQSLSSEERKAFIEFFKEK